MYKTIGKSVPQIYNQLIAPSLAEPSNFLRIIFYRGPKVFLIKNKIVREGNPQNKKQSTYRKRWCEEK